MDQVCTPCITQPRSPLGPPLHLCSHQPPYRAEENSQEAGTGNGYTGEVLCKKKCSKGALLPRPKDIPKRTSVQSQHQNSHSCLLPTSGPFNSRRHIKLLGLSDLLLTTNSQELKGQSHHLPKPTSLSCALGGMEKPFVIPPSCLPACAADRLQHCRLPTCLRRNRTKTSSAEAEGKEPAFYFFKGY